MRARLIAGSSPASRICSLLRWLLTGSWFFLVVFAGVRHPAFLAATGSLVFAIVLFYSARSLGLCLVAGPVRPVPNASPNPPPFVSLIIACYNEETVLRRSLPSLLALDYPSNRLEFLLVYESASTDHTEAIILEFARRDQRFRPLKRPGPPSGKASATNFGLAHATGEIIGIFDADHSLDSQIVKLAVPQFADPAIACVRGRCRAINRHAHWLARVLALERDAVERAAIYGAWRLRGFANFGGGQGFFRRELFDRLGRFDEEVLTEDIDFSVRIHAAGGHIAVLPQMQSWEEMPTSFAALASQRARWARGWMQIWRRYLRQIPGCPAMSWFKKTDTLVSLTSAVLAPFTILIFPLLALSACGYPVSCLPNPWTWICFGLAIATPLMAATWTLFLDHREPRPPSAGDLLFIPLLLPLIFLLFLVNWACFLDEFVLQTPYQYIKTARALK